MNGWHFMDEDDQLGVQQVQQSSEDVGPPITMVEAPNRDVASHDKEVSSQGDPLGHLVQEVLQPPPSEVDTSADTALAAVGYNPREWKTPASPTLQMTPWSQPMKRYHLPQRVKYLKQEEMK